VIRRDSIAGPPDWRALTWAPPTMTSAATVTVSADASAREFTLSTSQDYFVRFPSTPVTGPPLSTTYNTNVTITGGRNLIIVGGHISVPPIPTPTTLAAQYTNGNTTVSLVSTVGLPAVGFVNTGGYLLSYTGLSGNTLTGVAQDSFVYGDALSLPLPVGTTVYLGERARSGLSLFGFTGVAHIEGLLIEGDLVDSIRIVTASATASAQIQNCRLGPHNSHDTHKWDGHPDGIQLVNGPVAGFRCDRVTIVRTDSQGLLNKADGGNPCTSIILRDVDVTGANPASPATGGYLLDNNQTETTWTLANTWCATAGTTSTAVNPTLEATTQLNPRIGVGAPPGGFCPATVPGVNYVSPFYL